MIQQFNLSRSKIIEHTMAQCSQDFRGLRTQKMDMDTIFEDFAMAPDDSDAMWLEAENISVMIHQATKAYVSSWSIVEQGVTFAFDTTADEVVIARTLLNIYIYSLLAWWYESRLPDLSLSYRTKADDQLSELIGAVTPKFAERRLRMF